MLRDQLELRLLSSTRNLSLKTLLTFENKVALCRVDILNQLLCHRRSHVSTTMDATQLP